MVEKALASNNHLPDLVVIKPVKGWVPLNLRDLWLYRELIYFLTWRDLKVRYKQSVLGVIWAILKPTMTMIIFTIIFGNFAKIPSDGIPSFPILVCCPGSFSQLR
jgi:lipopolysaccharide transport system permease protein